MEQDEGGMLQDSDGRSTSGCTPAAAGHVTLEERRRRRFLVEVLQTALDAACRARGFGDASVNHAHPHSQFMLGRAACRVSLTKLPTSEKEISLLPTIWEHMSVSRSFPATLNASYLQKN